MLQLFAWKEYSMGWYTWWRAAMNTITKTHLFRRLLHVSRTIGHVNGVRTSCASWSHEQTTQSKEQNFAESSTPHDEESFDHGTEDGEAQLRSHILNAALPFVHSYGWSPDAIAQGAETLGYSSMVHGMFPGGGVELVNHFYSTCNTILEESLKAKVKKVEEKPELKTGTTAFIANAVEERLRMNIEYIDSWHKALALHASPRNTTTALHNLGTLVDHIWYHAGDRSTDFNWYTKRGILAAVYKSSELCMLQDKSEDFQDTWAFLNRRLSDVHKVAKCGRDAGNFANDFGNIAKAGIFTVLNIVGMNSKSRF
ncbi:ubiquinone biosynthesis protein COQ9-B, mitochondrial-like isoform X2 [Homarus americanus]|uniref:ubiquinone biosynthesis protein COQ9-B, mitochondrial-like isoform X2 n=1 Tax=Homarus americanus TaxID=6706 RepID=UPI001C45CDDB|nr:ubiquinone biosynthesis protein COQ9-B, mitochondrial-like isoform X2 [Homarus americanus]